MRMPKASAGVTRQLERLLAGEPRIRLRKMFGQPAAFANGNLCVGTFGPLLFVRLSEEDGRVLSKTPGVRGFEPMPGRVMKHYFVLPRAVLARPAESKKWVQRAIDYASTLPPK